MLTTKEKEIVRYLRETITPEMCSAISESSHMHRMYTAHFCRLYDVDIETMALLLHRVSNPKSRAEGIISINRNGGTSRNYRCNVCGARGFGSYCIRWPRTEKSKDECITHENYEVEKIKRIMSLFSER